MNKPQFIKLGTDLINVNQIANIHREGNICNVKMSNGEDFEMSYDILAKFIEVEDIDISVSIG